MTWIIIGLLALLALAGIIILRRGATITNLEGRTNDLKADVDRWQTQFRESREGKDATIAARDAQVSDLTASLHATEEKLEALLIAACEFSAFRERVQSDTWRRQFEYVIGSGSVKRDLSSDLGMAWIWHRDCTNLDKKEIGHWNRRPTADEFIACVASLRRQLEVNQDKWNEEAQARFAADAGRTDRQRVAQENAVIFARAIRKATAPMDEKALLKLSDDMLLGVLAWISKEASLPAAIGSSGWNASQVIRFFSNTLVGDAYLSVMLKDLVKHHNAEFMAVIDGMPPDIAQYLLRLTVTEPVAAAG